MFIAAMRTLILTSAIAFALSCNKDGSRAGTTQPSPTPDPTPTTPATPARFTINGGLVAPNPTKNIAVLQFYANSSYVYSVQLADITGKIILSKRGTAIPGANVEKFDIANFANGYYFLTLINNKGKKQTIKLLKE